MEVMLQHPARGRRDNPVGVHRNEDRYEKVTLERHGSYSAGICGGSGGNAKEAEAALELLSLKESGMGRVDFAEKDVSGSDATFKDVTIRTSELEPVEDDMDMETDDLDVDMEGADLNIETLRSGLEVDDAGIALFDDEDERPDGCSDR